MFNRALNWFTCNHSAPPVTEFESSTPSLSTAAPMVDEEDNLETPLLPTASHVVLECPSSVGSSIIDILKNPKCERVIICLVFLILFVIAVYHFVAEVNRISDDLQLDSVVVSSFNVSKSNFPETRWETELSLTLSEGDFEDLEVRYEAPRLWLYSRDGFVSMTSPSLEYSMDGKKLIMHGVFRGMQRDMKGAGGVVSLGMLMETNAMRKINIHVSEVEMKALVIIDCNDLKIEFDAINNRFGTLKDGANACKVHVCPLEPHPLYDGADKCTTSSPSSVPSSKLENF